MKSSASESVRNPYFNLERLSRSFRLARPGILHLNYASCNVKVDSLTFIYFQENYQTAEFCFYSYHVIPLIIPPIIPLAVKKDCEESRWWF